MAVPLLSTNFKVPSRIVIIIVIVNLVPGIWKKNNDRPPRHALKCACT